MNKTTETSFCSRPAALFACGRQSIRLPVPVYIRSSASVVGSREKQGPLGELFDFAGEDDLFGCDTWEDAESSLQRGVSLLIDIENSIKAQESRGYEQWAKIHNLKLAAKTMNFLTEHKIEQYADLVSRIEEVNAENEKTADALKSVEKRLANMAVLMKHVTTYQKTKPVYEAYRRAKDKDAYRAKQESSLILHEAAAKALKTAGVSKLPNVAALQVDYEKLREQKEALYADYGKLKKQVKEYDVIKQNIDSILRQPREPEREKGKERGE